MKIFSAILIFAFSLSFISCATAFVNDGEYTQIIACGAYGTLGMFDSDTKGKKVNIIERDEYGRVLFEYFAYNSFTQDEDSVYVICQKTDREYTYFYEDVCYTHKTDNPSEIERLKEDNDWKKELNPSEMSRRRVKLSFDLYLIQETLIDYKKAKDFIISNYIEENRFKDFYFEDSDNSGKELYILEAWQDEKSDTIDFYLVLFDTLYNPVLLKITPEQLDRAAIIEFKKINGWSYGF